MLFCSWCENRFYDGEWLTWRKVNGTEIPYHRSCADQWLINESLLIEIFHELDPAPTEFFERIFRDTQVILS